jgi:hypothetical protein
MEDTVKKIDNFVKRLDKYKKKALEAKEFLVKDNLNNTKPKRKLKLKEYIRVFLAYIIILVVTISLTGLFSYPIWAFHSLEIKDPTHYVFNVRPLRKFDRVISLERNILFNRYHCEEDFYAYKAVKNGKIYKGHICCEDKYKLCH